MPPKKCTSICTKKKTIDECNADERCKYANGKVRRYCHLSSKYTFDKLCNIIRKDNNAKLPSTVKPPSPIVSPQNITPPVVKKTRKTRKIIIEEDSPDYKERVSQLRPPIYKL